MFKGIAFVTILVSAAGAAAPAQELPEEAGNLAGPWGFCTDPADVGEEQGWCEPGYDTSSWRVLRAPGYWEAQGITEPRPGQEPKAKQGMRWTDYDGVAWYVRPVIVPEAWRGQNLDLLLGSVDDWDRTYFNGRLVGQTGPGVEQAPLVRRRYAVPAGLVRPGQSNVLAVRVEDGGGPGGLMGPLLSLLPHNKVLAMTTRTPCARPLPERFSAPPAEARILKIVHHLPDAPEAQDALIQSLLLQGFGGMVTNVSIEDYLMSDAKWAAFTRAVHEAKGAGMALWLYDERGYPSGLAGGVVMKGHPEWQARGLLIAETTSDGGEVSLELPPGELVAAVALPVQEWTASLEEAVDLTGHIEKGLLSWDAPTGSWHLLAITEDYLYENTHAAVSLCDKLPYIDLLSPEPTARFLEVTHDAYAERLGSDLGQWFTATFTDEPSLMGVFMRPQPYSVLPWASCLPVEFKRRRGYDIAPVLPALIVDGIPGAKSVRYDFWLTVGELVSESYFGQIQDWCGRHNVRSGGHLLCEESLLSHVPFYGDFFRCARRLDAPSIDCLTSIPEEVPWYIARLISSVAELEGRPVTMCETSDHAQRYRGEGDGRPVRVVTEDEIRGTCNRLIANGITTITSYYSFADLSTEQVVRLNEWIGRCSTMLAGGHQVADVAVVYPIESTWIRFTPSRHWNNDCSQEAPAHRGPLPKRRREPLRRLPRLHLRRRPSSDGRGERRGHPGPWRVALARRRPALRGHPSRGGVGDPRWFLANGRDRCGVGRASREHRKGISFGARQGTRSYDVRRARCATRFDQRRGWRGCFPSLRRRRALAGRDSVPHSARCPRGGRKRPDSRHPSPGRRT